MQPWLTAVVFDQGAAFPAITEAAEKHPELKDMCKRTYRKHFASLKDEDQKVQAKGLRARQVQAKQKIIDQHIKTQKQAKAVQLKINAQAKYTGGTSHWGSNKLYMSWQSQASAAQAGQGRGCF